MYLSRGIDLHILFLKYAPSKAENYNGEGEGTNFSTVVAHPCSRLVPDWLSLIHWCLYCLKPATFLRLLTSKGIMECLTLCRQKLRRLEVALIEYRESLEEHGVKNHDEIEKRVAMQRKKLEADCGLLDVPHLPSRDRDSRGADVEVERSNSGTSLSRCFLLILCGWTVALLKFQAIVKLILKT